MAANPELDASSMVLREAIESCRQPGNGMSKDYRVLLLTAYAERAEAAEAALEKNHRECHTTARRLSDEAIELERQRDQSREQLTAAKRRAKEHRRQLRQMNHAIQRYRLETEAAWNREKAARSDRDAEACARDNERHALRGKLATLEARNAELQRDLAAATEAVQHLSAGKPMGEIVGKQMIQQMAVRLVGLERELAARTATPTPEPKP